MPAMFSLALQPALRALQTELFQGEQALACLDDIYILAPHQSRCCTVDLNTTCGLTLASASRLLRQRFGTSLACSHLACLPLPLIPRFGFVWVGGHEIPSAERGVVALGVPVGTVQRRVRNMPSAPSRLNAHTATRQTTMVQSSVALPRSCLPMRHRTYLGMFKHVHS